MFSGISTCIALIRRDMHVFKPSFLDGIINCTIWGSLNVAVFKYIFPQLGVRDNYVVFMTCAGLMSWGLFEILGHVGRLAADLTTVKAIEYDLTLPLPQWMVFFRIAISNAIQSMSVAIFILPVSKLLLGSELTFPHISYPKALTIFFLGNLFYGFFSLFIASLMENMQALRNVWMRAVYPLWWIGGYQFSWTKMNAISPIVGKISLVNPLVYSFEGIRGAMLGQEGFINFWYCIVALLFFCAFFGYIGAKRMMRRLDCI